MRARLASLAFTPLLVLAACSHKSSSSSPPPGVDAGDPSDYETPPKSCAYQCDPTCTDWTSGYVCPAMAAWSALPHDPAACPANVDADGTSPAPSPAACTASAASADAIKYAGPDPSDATITVLPDGRRIQAAGKEWLFTEADVQPNAPVNVVAVPGTSWLVVVDMGYEQQAVRVVDATKIGSGSSPQVSIATFSTSEALNAPALFVAPDLVLVASLGKVQALKLDTGSGSIARDDTRSITLPDSVNDEQKKAPWYTGGIAASPDGTKLVVTSVFDTRALVFDLRAATYGKQLGSADIGSGGTFAAAFDPNDASGHFAYATKWGGHAVVELDVSDPTAPKASRTFALDKNPEGIAFLDARWMAVANDLGDAIALVDRTSGTVTSVSVQTVPNLYGAEPSNLAYDAAGHTLYATLAGANAVDALKVDTSTTPPTLTPAGMIPTSWWPSSVIVTQGGGLAITSMRGHSNGPLHGQYVPGDGDAMNGVRGAIQIVPPPSGSDLTAGAAKVASFDDVGSLAGAPAVTCPSGENDFPLPPTNTQGPSKKIDHVVFVLRENKTFDGVLGDLPTVNGDPTLALKDTSADMDKLWTNFRALVRAFATDDDYYTDAELSNQGHTWTTFGRESDFSERTWALNGYSRDVWASPIQPQGTSDEGEPLEGSLFDWLENNAVDFSVFGEAEGAPHTVPGVSPVATDYPGGFVQDIGYPDTEKACYFAARARVLCNMPRVTYATFPNDHTQGVSATQASPELMIATNDEATGMLVDAISHSPIWGSTLIVVTEDDPADGGDHVDHHRTPVLFVSPWIKHGYVSKQHIDVSSLHKMIAHLLGLPYANAIVARAALPLDLFSSAPDMTPYTYTPRQWPATCDTKPTRAEQMLHDSWSFDREDRQPGLDEQVARYLRGRQLQELTPSMKRDVAERMRARTKDDD
jgi:hypothetical protein